MPAVRTADQVDGAETERADDSLELAAAADGNVRRFGPPVTTLVETGDFESGRQLRHDLVPHSSVDEVSVDKQDRLPFAGFFDAQSFYKSFHRMSLFVGIHGMTVDEIG